MTDLLGARRLRALMAEHGVSPRRRLGQNFVIDPNTIRKIVSVADLSPSDRVLEIGAGAGSLTLGIAPEVDRVLAVEVDAGLREVLHESLAGLANVEIVAADALRMDLAGLDVNRLVGNLPYNIAVPVVLRVLTEAPQIERLTVMTQKEVGERMTAWPGGGSYGQVSVMVRYFAQAGIAASVSRRAFFPVPGVDSVIVGITRNPPPAGVDRERLFEVVRAAFAQRRKTLRNNLAQVAGSAPAAERALERAGLDPGERAEQVTLEGFVAVTREL